MSNVNIKRAVENISSRTSVYTPLVEIIVNAIDAIDALDNNGNKKGKVEVFINRSPQLDIEDTSTDITGFTVKDNGIGFTEENREAFDTLYTEQKIEKGGKGFGRFICLKYYKDLKVRSVYKKDGEYFLRKFKMGKDRDIIVDEDFEKTKASETGTTVELISLKQNFPDATVSTISRTLVEKLLPFFVEESYNCPTIKLIDEDNNESIILNNYIDKTSKAKIKEIDDASGDFNLDNNDDEEEFIARVFKIYSPKTKRSKVDLVAHRRAVTSTSLHNYIPEFSEEFFDTLQTNGQQEDRNFIVKVYVFGEYLDKNVSVERGGFEFKKDRTDLIHGISQKEIEKEAAKYGRGAVEDDVKQRRERTKESVEDYVREAPWYNQILEEVNYSELPYDPSKNQIESHLHKKKYQNEVSVKNEVNKLLESNEPNDLKDKASSIVQKVSDQSRNELTHYIALRKSVLDIFEKSLQLKENDKYESEDVVHEIIFPTREDSDSTTFEDHNLWIVDERLNFTEYLSSDKGLNGAGSDRPDILAFDKRIGFRGKNEPSNPVTIFEFKRPQRDDFVNKSKEDPVQQIIRYIMQIKDGDYLTPEGRNIRVANHTPFFGYVLCDITNKVDRWATIEKDFKEMPDGQGYFRRHDQLNLYIEILSWDKVLRDAENRNKVFFEKLGIV